MVQHQLIQGSRPAALPALLAALLGCAGDVSQGAAARAAAAVRLDDAAPLPVPRAAHGAAWLDGFLYVAGGGGRDDRRAWRLDLGADVWSAIAPAPRARAFPALAGHDGALFVVGGCESPAPGEEHCPAEIDRYDPASDSWSVVGELPRPRSRFGTLQLGRELWLVGGYVQQTGNVAWVDVLDLGTLTLRRAPDLPAAIHGCAVAAHGGDLLALGDQTDGRRAWLLRAGADAWAPLPDAPEARLFAVGVATAAADLAPPAFVVIGNRVREEVPVLGYVRSGDTWGWRYAEDVLVSTHRAPAVVVDGVVHCLGGETAAGETARVQRLRLDALRWR